MRFSFRCVAVAAILLALEASAQTPLVGVTNTLWRYLATGDDPGEAWKSPTFDDSSWPSGRGLFGYDTTSYPYPFNTAVQGTGMGGPMTAYYRTRFQWTGSISGVALTGTNHVDDGCVIYLNGVELARTSMPAGTITSSTLAGVLPEPVTVPIYLNLSALTNGNPNPLLPGENVIAVEVHQNSTGSSDHVFGLSLQMTPHQTTPDFTCGIIEHPKSQTVTAYQTVTFTMVPRLECFNPLFHWYFVAPGRQPKGIVDADKSTLVLTNVQTSDIGDYFCTMVTFNGTFYSDMASLDVNPDTEPPRLLYSHVATQYAIQFGIELRLVYDEPIELPAGGTQPSGWKVSASHADIIGIPCTVYAVHVTNRSEIALFITGPVTPDDDFWIQSSHEVADWYGNVLVGGISETTVELINVLNPSELRTWRYHDTGIDPGPNWMQPFFDDTSWQSGPQVFDSDPARETFEGWPIRTRLAVDVPNSNPPQRIPTYLFRVHLNLPNDFSIRHVVGRAMHDDGFVLYVNGNEVFRRGVSDAQFSAFGGSVETPSVTLDQPFFISGSNFVSGDNVIAVQLKQGNPSSSDATLGLQLQAAGEHIFVPTPPIFTQQPESQNVTEGHLWRMQVQASSTVIVHPGFPATYQWFHNGLPISGAIGTLLTGVARPIDAGEYQVQASDSVGSVTSVVATLSVNPVILSYGATWRYQTNQQDATFASTPWYATTFDDSSWPTAPGPFGWETSGSGLARLPAPIVTPLPVPDPGFRTAYFRARVNIPQTPSGQTLMLCHVVDDGAAFYIDGQLALRYNLTNALPIYSTNATPSSVPGDGEAQIVCVPFPLGPGEHLLAFEVHQTSTSTDVIAGLELRFVTPPEPTSIEIKRDASGNYFLEWTPDPFWELVQSSQLSGIYSRVPSNPIGRFTPPPAPTNRFFQLRFNGY